MRKPDRGNLIDGRPQIKVLFSNAMGTAASITSATCREKGNLIKTRLRTSNHTQRKSTSPGVWLGDVVAGEVAGVSPMEDDGAVAGVAEAGGAVVVGAEAGAGSGTGGP